MKLYRYDYTLSWPIKLFDMTMEKLWLREFDVIKETPQGKWVYADGRNRWISNNAIKRFAYPTVEEAADSFKRRKERQVSILEARLSTAKNLLTQINQEIENGNYPTSKR